MLAHRTDKYGSLRLLASLLHRSNEKKSKVQWNLNLILNNYDKFAGDDLIFTVVDQI